MNLILRHFNWLYVIIPTIALITIIFLAGLHYNVIKLKPIHLFTEDDPDDEEYNDDDDEEYDDEDEDYDDDDEEYEFDRDYEQELIYLQAMHRANHPGKYRDDYWTNAEEDFRAWASEMEFDRQYELQDMDMPNGVYYMWYNRQNEFRGGYVGAA